MPADRNAGTKELAAKIAARKKLIIRIVRFSEKLVRERGNVTHRSQGSCNTNVTMRLVNFGHFSFLYDWGQSMMGGNEVEIWYHPDREEVNMELIRPVLSVYYQACCFDPNEFTVTSFNDNEAWQSAISLVMRSRNRIIKQIESARRAAERQSEKEARRRTKRIELEERAQRLLV